jgi:exopolysaccharide biosynthesis polyprenyl glycosylphosphotransferase
MLKERARFVARVLLAADLAAVTGAFLLAYWLRDTLVPWLGVRPQDLYPLRLYLPLLPLALALWGLLLSRAGAYRSHRTISLLEEAWSVLRVAAFATVLFVLFVYALRLDEALLGRDKLSRLWLLFFTALSAALVLGQRTLVRLLSRYVRSRGYNYRNILIAGSGPVAASIVDAIEQHRHWGYHLVGLVGENGAVTDPGLAGRVLLGGLGDLPELVVREVVDEVIFAVEGTDLDRLEDLILQLEEQGVVVRLALDLFPHARARVRIGDLEGWPLLTFSAAPSSPFLLGLKRGMDLAMSLLLLVLALPAMGLIALAIKATSGGQVLFRQTRCGLNGRRFTLYKFRTMIEDAEVRRAELAHLNEMSGPVFKARRDPRITPLGRLLRRFSLDELPQLWNVLAGSMSLVGPRPPIPEEVAQYESWQRRRLSMRPGLTCLWQISGRNELDFDRWMELDLEYIDRWSPLLDLQILLKTVPVVLSGRGAS